VTIRSLIRCGVFAGAIGLGACDLVVTNPNNPDTERVLARPSDVEALLGGQYLRWHIGTYGNAISNVLGMANVLSFENFSSLANNGMGQVISIPRPILNNAVGNTFAAEHRRNYFIQSEVTRIASTVISQIDGGLSLGSEAQDNRARAFAQFMRGLSLGYLALFYDSAAIVTPEMTTEDAGELEGHAGVMAAALDAMQKAIDLAAAGGAGGNGFPLPGTWIPGPTVMSSAEFIRLVRSYRARLRANVARNPAERAAVDWDAVIADAQNGITADHKNEMSTTTGPFFQWVRQWNGFGLWHQMTPLVIGMADKSGSYAEYTAQSLIQNPSASVGPFFMVTDDLRFPQGADRAAQQADVALPCPQTGCGQRYFRNRPTGNDQLTGPAWGWSQYDHVRFHSWHQLGDPGKTAGNGLLPFFTKAELDMLEAEGHIRKSNFSAAAALINKTRTANGLGAITALDGTSPVPGGAACVPKVPSGTTVSCGNMMEAMKYEKRIETTQTHFAPWFLDGRGWGDIAEGTGICWAPPYEDLQARGRSATIYSTGGLGTGNTCTAAKGAYGW
jgi:hypothetical protein